MLKNANELSGRQIKFLSNLAGGMALREAAEISGYHLAHASRLHKSIKGQAHIAQLTEEAGLVLAARLPELVAEALDVLKERLGDPHGDRRFKAAELVLRYLALPMVKANGGANNNLIEMDLTNGKEAAQNDTTTTLNH